MLKRRILFYLSKWIKPVMIGRYKRSDGTVLPLTRICSSTFLQGENNLHVEDNVYIGHANFIDASNGLTRRLSGHQFREYHYACQSRRDSFIRKKIYFDSKETGLQRRSSENWKVFVHRTTCGYYAGNNTWQRNSRFGVQFCKRFIPRLRDYFRKPGCYCWRHTRPRQQMAIRPRRP